MDVLLFAFKFSLTLTLISLSLIKLLICHSFDSVNVSFHFSNFCIREYQEVSDIKFLLIILLFVLLFVAPCLNLYGVLIIYIPNCDNCISFLVTIYSTYHNLRDFGAV